MRAEAYAGGGDSGLDRVDPLAMSAANRPVAGHDDRAIARLAPACHVVRPSGARADRHPDEPRGLGEIIVSSRPYDEYLAMFDLTDDDVLAGPVNPAGAGAFRRMQPAGGS